MQNAPNIHTPPLANTKPKLPIVKRVHKYPEMTALSCVNHLCSCLQFSRASLAISVLLSLSINGRSAVFFFDMDRLFAKQIRSFIQGHSHETSANFFDLLVSNPLVWNICCQDLAELGHFFDPPFSLDVICVCPLCSQSLLMLGCRHKVAKQQILHCRSSLSSSLCSSHSHPPAPKTNTLGGQINGAVDCTWTMSCWWSWR